MGMKGRLFLVGILVLLVVLLVEACAGGAPVTAPSAAPTTPRTVTTPSGAPATSRPATTSAERIKLRMVTPSEPSDMHMTIYGVGSTLAEPIWENVYEPLVEYTKDGPVPRLATKWEPSPDLKRWRFYLRKGVKFQNGADFTAQDVVEYAKWNIADKERSFVYQRVPLKEAVAVDDYTVDFVFDQPQPSLLVGQRLFLIPPKSISTVNRDAMKTHPIGTGPYTFVEWSKGQVIKLRKFDGYWGPKPQIDDVEITFRPEGAVRVAALNAGETDWIYGLTSEQASRVPKAVHMPGVETVFLRFDESVQKDPILADKRLRLAIDYAIDRQKLVDLYQGFATLSLGQFASPSDLGFNPDLKSRPYDLEKAKSLVSEAGAVGKTVSLVGTTDRFPKDREVAEAIINMIEQTGLKVKPSLMTMQEAQKYLRVLGDERQYMSDLYLNNSDAALEVESRFRPIFLEGGAQYALNDSEPTRLFKEEQAENDPAKRWEKLGKAWAYVYEQAHYVPLYKPEWIWGTAKNLEWNIDVIGRPFFADMKFTTP